ncbi:arylsulfatase [Sinomicrobium soli]|uniref:arylsulfatase n=1 Tax=Sinomicrobium sp. N-1-3-6 TaxID=2219864 RepID=UPI000DCD5BDE|nr:arylsulfatase [Sinomicrobium sp. N-1-3-6]RAV29371.1 arylsulfatase [Sinomicrobium sp. N-1-3-6]
MNKRVLSLFFSALALTGCSGEKEDGRPNIIIIMADDLGFSDLGCYGGEIQTPNLDRLAENGVRMGSFYNTSRCCPSRAAMLTGLYQHQAGIGRMTKNMGLPGYQGTLDDETVTIAEVLKQSGYQTGMVGKWHVSETPELEKEKQLKWLSHQEDYGDFADVKTYPTARGFDHYYGNIWGVVDFYDPFSLVNGTEPVKDVPDDFYYTNAIGDSAVAYVDRFAAGKDPFFLYVAHCAPHWPLQAPEEVIDKYTETYRRGWKNIRAQRYRNLIEAGIIQSGTGLPEFMFPEKEWQSNPDREWDIRAMATHAAMVDIMDRTIGNLVDKLEATGELENTVIFFLSDNGASSEHPSRYGPGFDRPGSTRDGTPIAFPVEKDALPGPQTVTSGIGPEWSHVANTPYRYWKARVFEGGIKTPFIAHWPAKLPKGEIRTSAAHLTDLMATCIDLAGTTYPEEFNGHSVTPTRGHSIIPILSGETVGNSQEEYFWEHFGSAALRQGDLKLVKLDNGSDWELYDLKTDPTETRNVAGKHPERLEQMKKRWQELAEELLAHPAP